METHLKKSLRIAAAVAGAVSVFWGSQRSCQAGDVITVDAGVDFYSKYVWRGMQLTDGPVLQPSVTVSAYGLSLNVWSSFDVTDANEGNESEDYHLQELDYTLSYGFAPVEGIDMEVGIIHYTFPGTIFDSTEEAYASIGFSSIPLSPSITAYYDFDEVDDATEDKGLYVSAGVEHTFDLSEKLGLTLAAALGWGNDAYHEYYYGATPSDGSSLSDLLLTAGLSYALNDTVSLTMTVGYSDVLDGDVADAAGDGYENSTVLFAGAGVSVSF